MSKWGGGLKEGKSEMSPKTRKNFEYSRLSVSVGFPRKDLGIREFLVSSVVMQPLSCGYRGTIVLSFQAKGVRTT